MKANIIFLYIFIVPLFFITNQITHALFYNFGGRVMFTLPCLTPPGVWYVVVGIKGGAFVNYPPASLKYWFFPPFPGTKVLGKALLTPVPCMITPPPFPVFVFGLPVLFNGVALPP